MQISSAHTLAVFRNGIRFSLPQGLNLLSGPGCPACVVDQRFIDAASYLADSPDCIIATYPDMLQMPSVYGTLGSKQLNGNINLVDGADQALQLAKANPHKTVVFIAVVEISVRLIGIAVFVLNPLVIQQETLGITAESKPMAQSL